MSRVATKKQRGFARDYLETGHGTKAALKNYDLDKNAVYPENDYMTAAAISSENLKKPKVQALIDGYAERAEMNMQTLAEEAKNEQVKFNANKDQLDRAGYQVTQRTENKNLNVNVQTTLPQKAIDIIEEDLKQKKLK